MIHDLLRQGCVVAACLKDGSAHTATAESEGKWAWRPAAFAEDARFPHVVLLFAEPGESEPLSADGGRVLAGLWPLRCVRAVELAGCRADAGLAVRLLEGQPVLYDLLPARLLAPGKEDGDPLFAAEVNGLARAAWLAGSARRFAEVTAVASAQGRTPPRWQYRSWRTAAEVTITLADEPRPPLWSYLDPIVLRVEGELGPTKVVWRSRLEQFRAPG